MLLVSKRLHLRYDRPIRHARRILRVRPLAGHACWRGHKYLQQHALDFQWRCEPEPSRCEETAGALMMEAEAAHDSWRFEMQARVQVLAAAPQALTAREADVGRWLLPSRLCERTPRLCDLAQQSEGAELELAQNLNLSAHASLRYQEGATDGATSAAQALGAGAGVCQDFAHILIALCRARGLAARYVSGFGHAPGRMHAWAEVWAQGCWHAFDPTHGSSLDERAVAVAIGRDFRDVRPLEGSFEASGQARAELSTFCCVREDNGTRSAPRNPSQNP